MTKTKNRKGKKKHAKHLDNVEARVSTIQHQKATLSAGIPAGGLDRYLKANGITPDVHTLSATLEDHARDTAPVVEDAVVPSPVNDFAQATADRLPVEQDSDQRWADLGALSITDLRKYSKGSGIPGAYGLKKADLIEAIIAADWFAS